MTSIELSILNDNVAIASIPLSVEVLLSTLTGIFTIIASSFALGIWFGRKFSYDKGFKDGEKQGFSNGKSEFIRLTKTIDNVICEFNPNKQALLNGISITKQNNGEVVSVECPYKEKENTCQITKNTCCKL